MSMQRRCDVWKATDGKWYMLLGIDQHDYDDEDCVAYGPFEDQAGADAELDNHSNPGSMDIDESGTRPPPANPTKSKPWSRGFYV